jgi:hypothetical protein
MADPVTETFDPDEKVVVYWADLPCHIAARYATDGENWWADTQPALMERFSIPPSEYWDMTVADHGRLIEYVDGFTKPEDDALSAAGDLDDILEMVNEPEA